MNNKFSNIFTSKANVLEILDKNIKKSTIEKLFYFTTSEWNKNETEIIKKIKLCFHSSEKIIIRSSAIGEDSTTYSAAGLYESILDVNPKSTKEIKSAIKSVIKSYIDNNNKNSKNQILIQNQTFDINTSGVIFTRTPNTGSPYYTINYEDTGTTTQTTHGLSNKTIKIYRNTIISKLPKLWKQLISSIKEIEKFCNSDALDIEFGITNSQNIIIFQVRPITTIEKYPKNASTKSFHQILQKNIKNFSLLQNKSTLPNKQLIFSDMADWNPAEIIGDNPNNLAYSLYRYLITDDIWFKSRLNLGYQKPSSKKLMKKFGNKPYIDVHASFTSLIPKNFSPNLTKKLLNFYIFKLKNNIDLHDKVEFQILFTCYDFMLDERLNELKKFGFSQTEIIEIQTNLSDFTKELLISSPKIISNCKNDLKKLILKRKNILAQLEKPKISHKTKVILIKELLDDCKIYGTLSFSIMARLSFIGTILLKSFEKYSNSQSFFDSFLSTLSTPLTEIQNDFVDYKNKKLSKSEFLKKYGHLRPGTYDITNLTYSENEDFLSNITFSKKIKPNKLPFNEKKFSKLLLTKLNIDPSFSITNFISTVIVEREKFKFEFTKNLSISLDLISQIGNEFKISRNDISNLDILDILKSKLESKSKIFSVWQKKIESQKKSRILNETLILPQVITSKHDFEIINFSPSKPNYITNKIIKKHILELNSNTDHSDIKNSILLIENADPGFDWIFTKNPAGLITKYGGVASHMAIRCAEIGLPAAIGTGELLFEKLRYSIKIELDCKNQQIFILEDKNDDLYIEEKKMLKSLGYIK